MLHRSSDRFEIFNHTEKDPYQKNNCTKSCTQRLILSTFKTVSYKRNCSDQRSKNVTDYVYKRTIVIFKAMFHRSSDRFEIFNHTEKDPYQKIIVLKYP
jgi:hypothetical protein